MSSTAPPPLWNGYFPRPDHQKLDLAKLLDIDPGFGKRRVWTSTTLRSAPTQGSEKLSVKSPLLMSERILSNGRPVFAKKIFPESRIQQRAADIPFKVRPIVKGHVGVSSENCFESGIRERSPIQPEKTMRPATHKDDMRSPRLERCRQCNERFKVIHANSPMTPLSTVLSR
jgi:hypothetical protein